jgi:phenylpyruvate tautomerase PptA (4-oxalocrotonate tautomerase family)
MPILDVEIVGRSRDDELEGLAQRIADAAGSVFGSEPGQTWVKLTLIPIERYAENAPGRPQGVFPVFVRVLERKPPRGSELQRQVRALTDAVAEACGRTAENVHLVFDMDARGRTAFGGRVVAD